MSPAVQTAFATALRHTYVHAGAAQAQLKSDEKVATLSRVLPPYCDSIEDLISMCRSEKSTTGAATVLPHIWAVASEHRKLAAQLRRMGKKHPNLKSIVARVGEVATALDDLVEDFRDAIEFAPDAEAADKFLATHS